MWPSPILGNLAVRVPLIMLAVIFALESAIMAVIALIGHEGHSRWLEVVVDASVLTLTMAPLLYWLVVRPLRALADERSRLLAHMMEIQDAERQRVARDLHDEIGQSFTSLLVQLRLLNDAPSLDAAKAQARGIRELSGHVYDQIRTLARGLYPTVLDDLGLPAAVRRMAEDFEDLHGVTVTVQVSGIADDRLDRKVEMTAYRVVQESLTNCAKHAQATCVEIALVRVHGFLTVTIADNGRGFDLEKTMHSSSAAAFGLTNLRERALLLNGSFGVRSRPGGGTTVTLRIPVRD